MDKDKEENIKKRIIDVLKEKGEMSMSEIHERTGISFYSVKDVVPLMVNEGTLVQTGKKLNIKQNG